jgi:hypothetical protein
VTNTKLEHAVYSFHSMFNTISVLVCSGFWIKLIQYDKQDRQGKAAFNERSPHPTQQQASAARSPGGLHRKTGQGTRQSTGRQTKVYIYHNNSMIGISISFAVKFLMLMNHKLKCIIFKIIIIIPAPRISAVLISSTNAYINKITYLTLNYQNSCLLDSQLFYFANDSTKVPKSFKIYVKMVAIFKRYFLIYLR